MWSTGLKSLNHDLTTSHIGLSHAPIIFIIPPQPAYVVWQCKGAPICPSTAYQGTKTLCLYMKWMRDGVYGVLVHPYDHPQHIKVLKHFVYIWYGCWMWFIGLWSLNHDLTISLVFIYAPNFAKIHPHLHRWNSVRVHPYAHPQHIKVLKHFVY